LTIPIKHEQSGEDVGKATKNKSRKVKQKNQLMNNPSGVDRLLALISEQIEEKDFSGVIDNCERLLHYLPQKSRLLVEVFAQLGLAHAMLQNYPQSYEAYTAALALNPNEAGLWYNRSVASFFTMRLGRALHDIERAIELNPKKDLIEAMDGDLMVRREAAEEAMKMRGPDFTLDQLIEQEDLFQQGLKMMDNSKWNEAVQAFQSAIEMGDCLPQPWGNLGTCWVMQERFDDAEVAWKRALVIDPDYTLAKSKLAELPEVRRTGLQATKTISLDPFRDVDIATEIIYPK